MLDRKLIDELDSATCASVKVALMSLYQSGILEQQMRLNMQPVVTGFGVVEADQLAKEIVAIRETNRILQGFHELGKQMAKEYKS